MTAERLDEAMNREDDDAAACLAPQVCGIHAAGRKIFRKLFTLDLPKAQAAYLVWGTWTKTDGLDNYRLFVCRKDYVSVHVAFRVARDMRLCPQRCLLEAVRAENAALVQRLLAIRGRTLSDLHSLAREAAVCGSAEPMRVILEAQQQEKTWRLLAAECMERAAATNRVGIVSLLVSWGVDPFDPFVRDLGPARGDITRFAAPKVLKYLTETFPGDYVAPP